MRWLVLMQCLCMPALYSFCQHWNPKINKCSFKLHSNLHTRKKKQHPPCADAPEPGWFPQYKSARPPQESGLAGTNEWTTPRHSHSLHTETQGASTDIFNYIPQNAPPKRTCNNRHKHEETTKSLLYLAVKWHHPPKMRCSLLCVWKA